MSIISFRERFIGLPNPSTRGLYAPLTLGAPEFLHPVNYKEFKKSKDEKQATNDIKSDHKRRLIEAYGKGNTNRKMNP